MKNVKTIYCIRPLLLSLFTMVSSIAYAFDIEVEGIYYNYMSIENCVSVTYPVDPNNNQNNYYGNIVIPSSVEIDGKSFDVYYIGNYAFDNCTDLNSVVLPESLWGGIGSCAFRNTNISSIVLPESVSYIGSHAFQGTKLSSIVIPKHVSDIRKGIFRECQYLTSIVVDGDNKTYDSRNNCNGIIETNTNTIIAGCLSTVIPNSVISIGEYAFDGIKMETITIPSSVSSIGTGAFRLTGLKTIVSEIVNPFAIPASVFEGISADAVLQVPKGTKDLYQNYSGWTTNFKSIVEEGDDPSQITAYTLSITTLGNGTASYNGETIRGTAKSYSVNEEMSVTVNFIPDSGYRIKSLKVNGSSVSTTTSYSFNVNSDTTIEVEFELIPDTPSITTYSLSITASGNGSANYGGEAIRGSSRTYSLNEGSSVSLSFTPDEGYRIESVKVNGSNIGDGNSYSTTINANTTVEVVFEAIPITTYTLSVTASGNGVATFDGTEVRNGSHSFTVNEGSDVIISLIPDMGYKVEVVKEDGNEVEISESYTINNITSDKTLEVVFVEMDRNFSIDGVGYQIESFEDNSVTLTGVQNSITLEVSDKINYQAQDWNIIGISENALENSEELAAIIWNPEIPFTAKVANPNLLLYVKDEAYAPAGIRNVVVNGFAKTITLTDAQSGNNFFCPSSFTTQSVIYTHNYSMKTGINESKGWETIALPFDVQKIIHNRNEIIPFAKWSTESNSKPFWLYELKGSGFVEANGIKANTPYIISMPNNDLYEYDYNLSGEVTFSALNAEVKKSDEIIVQSFGDKTFVPNYLQKAANEGYYVLNVNNDYITDESGGNEGSRFILNLRKIHPFESYMTSSSNARSFEVFDGMKTAIRGIKEIAISQKKVKVYDLSGILLKVGTSLDAIKQDLPAGVYIVNNQKKIIK